jgi:hypothetical protein
VPINVPSGTPNTVALVMPSATVASATPRRSGAASAAAMV